MKGRRVARALLWPVQLLFDFAGWWGRLFWMLFVVSNPLLLAWHLMNREKRASSLDAARESGDDADVQEYVHWLKNRRKRT